MKSNRWSWRERGVHLEDIQNRLAAAIAKSISYENDPVMGFPGTTPLATVLDVHRQFAGGHPNNIGHHTGDHPAEFGFEGTQELEREFIYTLANLVGAEDPERDVDGYVCMGGTEGNDHGLWLARNKLRFVPPAGPSNGIAVITSFLSHYSVDKHFGRLFNTQVGDVDVDVLIKLPTDKKGELDPQVVEQKIRELRRKGYSRFLLVLTAGTTNMGSVDPTYEICDMLSVLREELHINTHVHVDAAFGGFVIPFLEPETRFGFHHPLVDSMVVDAHKMGYTPYSAGVFMCRKGELKHTEVPAQYLGGHSSFTVCGSRSGAIGAACWSLTQLVGREELRATLQQCMENLAYLREILQAFNCKGKVRVKFYPTRMNIQAVWVADDILHAITETKDANGKTIQSRFCIPDELLPSDLTNPTWEGNVMVRDMPVIRFTAMPHLTRSKIDHFMDELMARVA